MSIVHNGTSGLCIDLRTGVVYDSFFERRYLASFRAVTKQTNSVLSVLPSRSLFQGVEGNIFAPAMGEFETESAAVSAYQQFVLEGHHVEGVAARLLALGLEHALVPFTQRTRVRNANASYWFVGKYKSDSVTLSIQNAQQLDRWANPGMVGTEHDPTVVVWVGNATKVRGMSLLSRIMDEGGPILLQDAYLCRQFNPGKLLMAGTGSLPREFRAIQPEHLMDAIDEALWLLVTYNGLSVTFIRNAIRLLIRNLPVVDLAHYREHVPIYWRVRTGEYGDPQLTPDVTNQLRDAVNATFSTAARACVGLNDAHQRMGFCSDLFRRQILAPDPLVAGLAPAIASRVDWRVAAVLGALQSADVRTQGGVNYHHIHFDVAAPPSVTFFQAITRNLMDDVMLCFSGRSGYVVYAFTPAPVAPADVNALIPAGWQLDAAAPATINALVGVHGLAAGGAWVRWVGGNDQNGVPHLMRDGLQCYVVYHAIPTSEAAHMTGFTAPEARLRRFDVPADFRMAVRATGDLPDILGGAPRVGAYIADNVKPGTPLEYVQEGELRRANNLTAMQRAISMMIGLGYCWDAAHGANAQNDAYRRWLDANHVNIAITTVPDELKVYLGGVRCRKYLEACGGLWTLCFTPHKSVVHASAGHESILEFLRRPDTLSSYILKLRCAVEMSDQMCRVSNARLTGCQLPFLWPDTVNERLEDAGVDQLTIVDLGKYMARQACILAAVFDHPDSAVVRSFGVEAVSTMRLREVSAIDTVHFTESVVQHINWLTPQVLNCATWMYYYGVAAPSFVPDRTARGWLRAAKFSTRWQGVASEFLPGGMIDRDDEIWCAVLSGLVYHDWYPATLVLAQYGKELVVNVSDVRTNHCRGYTAVQMRLNLPYETRLGTVTVRGANLNASRDVRLPCAGVSGWRDGEELLSTTVAYSGEGLVTDVTLEVDANNASLINGVDACNLDLNNTTFANRSLSFGIFRPNLVVLDFPEVQRCSGHFWLKTVVVDEAISAGFGAGTQRLLQYLGPPEPLAVADDGGAGTILARQQLLVDAPDVASQAVSTPDNRVGNEPLHEVSPQMANQSRVDRLWDSFTSSIEVNRLMATALSQIPMAIVGKRQGDSNTATTAASTRSASFGSVISAITGASGVTSATVGHVDGAAAGSVPP
jgi:hypothetical protein